MVSTYMVTDKVGSKPTDLKLLRKAVLSKLKADNNIPSLNLNTVIEEKAEVKEVKESLLKKPEIRRKPTSVSINKISKKLQISPDSKPLKQYASHLYSLPYCSSRLAPSSVRDRSTEDKRAPNRRVSNGSSSSR